MHRILLYLGLLGLTAPVALTADEPHADLVLQGGAIYTVNAQK